MTRHEAREEVFKLVFEFEYNREKVASDILNTAIDIREINANDYIKSTFEGVLKNIELIDEKISKYSLNWKLSRLSNVTISILRLAIYEIMFTDTPKKVCVNEAVEIAKAYDDKAAPAFINGILNKVIHENDDVNEVGDNVTNA